MALTQNKALEIILDKTKAVLLKLRSPALEHAEGIVIRTEKDFIAADSLRSQIKGAIKVVEEKLDPIIADIRPGLDKLYALKRSEIKPLEEADGIITAKMQDYRRAEQRKLQEEQRKRDAEARRLEDEAEDKRRKAAQAATPQVAKRLERQAEVLVDKLVDVVTTPVSKPMQAEHSATRKVRKWKIADRGTFIQAILDGEIPEEMILINDAAMNKMFRSSPATVETYPGVSVFEDVEIVGRR